MQKQLEKSERLKTGEMTSQQERERAAAEAAHEARKNRAIGAAQCGGGAIDVGRIIKKTVHNLDAIEKGQLGEIQMVNLSDVQMNNAAKVAGAVPKAKKMEKMAGFL
uniref:Uncharacterized protein n=1 Tax=Panagrolaimus sp. JU765 TaxID=591449 RepID=A0AC34RB59_9BILA